MNIKSALIEGRSILQNQTLPVLEAEILLSFTLSKPKEYLITHSDQILTTKQQTEFINHCDKRADGQPIEHITRQKEFYSINLFVDENVLIPRPETEILVDEVLNFCQKNQVNQIIEIGTGSGNISIAIAKNIPNIPIIAGELSAKALKVAKKNIQSHHLENRIELRFSNLLENIPETGDIIVANLPYIGKTENNFISKEAENYEPHIALFGGSNGLELYDQLFQNIQSRPNQPKLLLGEFGFSQGQNIKNLLDNYFAPKRTHIKQDLAGLDRYFLLEF